MVLTIAIPCYNVEEYIEKGLSTLSDKRFINKLEVLIIDDGSKDNTWEKSEKFVNQYPDIFTYIYKDNGGHGSVINRGIKEAHGKYFRILDGDDWVDKENLIKLLDILEKCQEDLVVDKKCDINMVTNKENHIPLPESIIKDKEYKFKDVCLNMDVSRYFMIHNFSIKTSLLKKYDVNVLENVFYEDSEYVLKATSICETICFLDLEIYQYMIGNVNQSVSAQNFVKRYEHFDMVTRKMLEDYILYCSFNSNENIKTFLQARVRTVILTQLYISLIYNTNRKEGKKQAIDLISFVQKEDIHMYELIKNKYHTDLLMHTLGINYNIFQFLRKLCGKTN